MKQGTVGTYGSESLPNITASIYGGNVNICNVQWVGSGAFQPTDYRAAAPVGSYGSNITGYNSAKIDASLSSSIYKNNAKVNPYNAEILYVIKF